MRNVPLALARSNRGTVNLPGVEGQDLSWRDNVPLYSAVGLAAAALPAELSPFSYAIGGQFANNWASPAAGVTTATNYHTNLRVPRQLPAPEVFVFDRIRVFMAPVSTNAPGTDNEQGMDDGFGATGNSGLSSINSNDLLLLQTLTLRLELEQKLYAEAPLWMFPSNVGIGGVATHAMGKFTAGTNSNMRRATALHWAGEGWRFADSMPPVLTSSTVLDCRIRYEHPGTAPSLLANRLLFVVLQGRHGRAVR